MLFADLVGFGAVSPSTRRTSRRSCARTTSSRAQGSKAPAPSKFIGDAVMALFGAPTAHEDDRASGRAAHDPRLGARRGGWAQDRITTGEALVSLDARPEAGEGMAAGDVVNTAARLQGSAPANGILVDEATCRATRERIEYADAEPVSAKGKAEPVLVWEVGEALARFGADVVQAGAPLGGRRRELDLLGDALGRAREEGSPQLVTLVGVPGIGRAGSCTSCTGSSALRTSSPTGTGPLASLRRASPAGRSPRWRRRRLGSRATDLTRRREVEGDGGRSRRRERGADARGLRPRVGLGGEADAGGDRSERCAAWRAFFESLAEQRPTVLVFEDLHWADDDLLDFVDHLVEWASGVPLLVVGTARPELLERRSEWGGGKPNALTLSISPLSNDDTARLLGTLLERAVLPVETQDSLLVRAGGNPLYAEQFARLLAETGGEEQPLPENVQGIIAARLDGLPPDEKQLLQNAAVLGKVFWLGAACAVGGLARIEAEERLHALERRDSFARAPVVCGQKSTPSDTCSSRRRLRTDSPRWPSRAA